MLVWDALLLRADDSASLVNQYTLHCTEVKFRMTRVLKLVHIFIASFFVCLFGCVNDYSSGPNKHVHTPIYSQKKYHLYAVFLPNKT